MTRLPPPRGPLCLGRLFRALSSLGRHFPEPLYLEPPYLELPLRTVQRARLWREPCRPAQPGTQALRRLRR